MHGPVSGDMYQTGYSYNTNPTVSYVFRFSDASTVSWTKFYDFLFAWKSIAMHPNETVIYAIEMSTSTEYTYLYSFHTDNGTVAMSKRMHGSR